MIVDKSMSKQVGHINVDDFKLNAGPECSLERYKPQFHFSPQSGWMNDPNGMVYYKGEYHLFYQHYPSESKHGPMHWGHTVSTDLVHWEHLPIALYPDEIGTIFSGSVVIDKNNTSGFKTGDEKPFVAIFTHNSVDSQVQSIAYSNDSGRTWTKYQGNPVITSPEFKDFRDPKVFWHDETSKWIMVLVAGDRIQFYTSENLKFWSLASEFGSNDGSHAGVWECPDLFELPVDGDPKNKKWVLIISINPGGIYGGSGIQYFVGDFDGINFINDNPPEMVLWADYGMDNYAAVSWSDIPESDGRRIWIGWANNWIYAKKIPTSSWRGIMSIPRELQLANIEGKGIRLVQKPVNELKTIREEKYCRWEGRKISSGNNLLSEISGDAFEIISEFEINNTEEGEFGFKLRTGANEATIVGYDISRKTVFVDRTNSGICSFSEVFSGKHSASLDPKNGKVRMRIYVDRSSVELFANDGEVVITDQIFPEELSVGMELYSANDSITLVNMELYHIKKTE